MAEKTLIKAAVCRQFGAPLEIETLSLSPPTNEEVRVKLSACAICHSDIIYMDGGWGGSPPIVFGHEAAGVVVEAKSGFKIGEHVLVSLLRSCGACSTCEQGVPSQCEAEFNDGSRLFDSAGLPVAAGLKTGGFAEQVVVDRSQVVAIPKSLPFDEASLLSCSVITGWGAVTNTANVPAGATVAVIGCGGVGINCVQAAAQSGASLLVAIDVAKEKLTLAKKFGATQTVFAGNEKTLDKARHLTNGRGFDYVFMAAGSAKAVELAANLMAKMGTMVLVGMPLDGDLATINTTTIASQQQRILGCKMGETRLRVDIPKLIRLYASRRLKLKELISGHYPLAEINNAIDDSKKGGALRNIIVF